METSGFYSPRTDAFPAGLRVLVVDDDPTWLKILEKMLKKCSYEVTTSCLAREALDLLRERKDGFDIVISDVNMPDMDGFKLLEHVGLEMDLPVIMMSVDGETSRVMKGVQHGACDYLLKPIRMKELRNIWQHVFRKKIHEVRDVESHEGVEDILRSGSDQSDDGYPFSGGDFALGKKRKDYIESKQDDKDFGDPSSLKKARVVWTVDLHQKFVKAVNQIGFEKVGPKKILDLMNVPRLTRENVASHLQKYRLYLSRIQKDNDLRASFGGMKHSDLSSKDSDGIIGFQNPIMQQDGVVNGRHYGIPRSILVQPANPKTYEGDPKGIISLPMTEKRAQVGNTSETRKANSSSLNHSFGSLERDARYPAFDSTVQTQYSWGEEVPKVQFGQEHKPHLRSENDFNHLPLLQVNNPQPSPSTELIPLYKERYKPAHVEVSSSHLTKCRNQNVRQETLMGNAFGSFSVQPDIHTTNFKPSEPIASPIWSNGTCGLDQISVTDLESAQGNLILGRGSAFASLNDDLHTFLQGDCSSTNLGLQNKELLQCTDTELIAEVSPYLYDALRFDYECSSDSNLYPVIDQGLFIA
ncbi:hypothetical protein RJ639_008549 [Escallonia herrerae]|uniref:Response regulatory domain-containing protein n=1 Tax=Escallonia herrerae TaxID=1293975 RepID=A0AA89AVM6_9ASTE|nr:hypothetical protein RJ639_008549 [Escallonia herrerae]